MSLTDHVVHVGMVKTGSTWLQRHVFPTVEGAVATVASGVFRELLLNLTDDDEFMRETFRSALGEIHGRVLLSWEGLSGRPWGHWDVDRNADRLATVIPAARIIVVTRDPDELARSLYGQYVNSGGYVPMGTFLDDVLDHQYLDIPAIVAAFRRRFSRVLEIPYRELRSEPYRAVSQIESFADIRFPSPLDLYVENASLTGWRLRALRLINRWFRISHHNPAPKWPMHGAGGMRNVLQHGQARVGK